MLSLEVALSCLTIYYRYMQRRPQTLQFLFGALSIVVGFNINLPFLVGRLAVSAGFENNSVGQQIMINTLVPGAIVLLAFLATTFYTKLIWPITGSRGGLWCYAHNAHIEGEELPIIGWFRIIHSPWSINIAEGCAYYFEDGELTYRGDWTSDTVWAAEQQLGFLFTMISQNVTREPSPSQYQGVTHYTQRSGATRRERTLWTGYFHDLDDRRGIHGPSVCIRIRRHNGPHPSPAELLRYSERLMEKIFELEGRPITPDVSQPGAIARTQ